MKKMVGILLALTVITAVTFIANNSANAEPVVVAKVLPGNGGGGGD